MTPLFEMPKLLTLSGDPFTSHEIWGEPHSCQKGCWAGCLGGCVPGSGGDAGSGGDPPPEPDIRG